jgi:hypothetical protein
MNQRMAKTAGRLLALIDHPRTGEDERDAARRALKRLDERQAQASSDTQRTGERTHLWNPGAWQGSKYEQTRRLSLTEIAKLIREDIKMSRKAGRVAPGSADLAIPDPIADAPAEIKYSVRTRYYAGGGAIDLTIKNVPAAWGWTEQTDEFGQPQKIATPAFEALFDEVERIHNAYNYDNSDSQADYFERNYWGHVSTEERVRMPRPWQRAANH